MPRPGLTRAIGEKTAFVCLTVSFSPTSDEEEKHVCVGTAAGVVEVGGKRRRGAPRSDYCRAPLGSSPSIYRRRRDRREGLPDVSFLSLVLAGLVDRQTPPREAATPCAPLVKPLHTPALDLSPSLHQTTLFP